MSQVTDKTVGANPTGFDMRTELNNIIAALESDNSGSSEPLNTVAYMKWLDTSDATYYYYKERNHDNTAWVTLFRYTVATKIMEAVSNGVVLQDSALVHKTGDETIEGVKTFSSSPIVPTPTAGTQVANKDYVDSKAVGIGVGQTWQSVTGSRAKDITYTNTTGKSIMVAISLIDAGTGVSSFEVSGVRIEHGDFPTTGMASALSMIVPNGATYRLNMSGANITSWAELR